MSDLVEVICPERPSVYHNSKWFGSKGTRTPSMYTHTEHRLQTPPPCKRKVSKSPSNSHTQSPAWTQVFELSVWLRATLPSNSAFYIYIFFQSCMDIIVFSDRLLACYWPKKRIIMESIWGLLIDISCTSSWYRGGKAWPSTEKWSLKQWL